MSKLHVVSGKDMIKVLTKIGFTVDRQKGSHIYMIKHEPSFKAVSVPNHKELKRGTLRNILKRSGLTVADLAELLK